MTRKQLVILVAGGLIVVLGIIGGVLTKKGTPVFGPTEREESATSAPVEEGTAPVAEYTAETPKNAEPTKPQIEAPAAPGRSEKLGIFEMTVSSRGFEPNSITVNKGDVIQIRLTALDGDYDFTVPYNGLYVALKAGETKQVTFGATTAGTFGFTCRDFCPRGKTIGGSIIVLPTD